jgi:heme exporter protein CcmD
MTGVVTGGWSFVIAAYGLTALVLIIYTASVVARYRRERQRVERGEP